ncbi:hypothetical protein HPULCUR_006484 [Helicostylum pulchrum]|uniref:Uncharacterized protein n=1 Tax=Helicostylum pulchrum TaxID=562976 RepID=A0ABP9Y222_9FUNG
MDIYMDDFLRFHPTTKHYSKKLFATIDNMKSLLKNEKSNIRKDKSDNKNMKKIIVKITKVFRDVTNNGRLKCWIREEITENEFTTRFVIPVIDLILKPYKSKLVFKPGEQKLVLVKDYENSALTEDDTRLPEPNIDGIIKNTDVDVVFSLLEVSGSPDSASINTKASQTSWTATR